ncbi:hypothetical protein VTO42DRAFT_1026 [Malbranchea cinnamomea]
MSPHRYQRVDNHNDDDDEPVMNPEHSGSIPSSPPPSFHSRESSRSRSASPSSRLLFSQDPLHSEADRTLEDTFGDYDDEHDEIDDRQRLMRGDPSTEATGSGESSQVQLQSGSSSSQGESQRTNTTSAPQPTRPRIIHDTYDGVFANLSAKPERGEKLEDLPPSYEQAAADATPPYWETTIVTPGLSSNEVYVDGLPVGSFFSFIWNGMISTSFQLVGFLLTYLLHTTHAAKNGSRAGLGLTLVQYGFYMRGGDDSPPSEPDAGGYAPPPDPNSHDFNPDDVTHGSYNGGDSHSGGFFSSISTSDWISYILMIVGWFVLIRAVSDYLRARRHEQLVLQSPDRGLPVPIIAEGERAETVV